MGRASTSEGVRVNDVERVMRQGARPSTPRVRQGHRRSDADHPGFYGTQVAQGTTSKWRRGVPQRAPVRATSGAFLPFRAHQIARRRALR